MNLPNAADRDAGRAETRSSTPVLVWALFSVVVALVIDAMIRDRTALDVELLQAVQRVDFPGQESLLTFVGELTGSTWAIATWACLVLGFLAFRRWLEAVALLSFPLAGAVNWWLRTMVQRSRPPDEALLPGSHPVPNDFASFPSGHVVGAVLLYGFLFVVAGQIRRPILRWAVRAPCVAIIVLVGFSRAWTGAHWVGDVVAAYALGGLVLLAVTAAYNAMRPSMSGIPLLKAQPIPVDESLPHAHALTSTLMFRDGRVFKMYAPGFIPRLIYWFSFQAPFAYSFRPRALEAAVARRNLAGLLTEYWYGERLVAAAYSWTDLGGRLALVSEYIDGHEPANTDAARSFLLDLTRRFDEAGLPTWQVDPRQPRSLGNAMETAPGRFMVIDLESGLVSPMASPRAWKRAFRRGLVPLYDDVFFDITRGYVAARREDIEAKLGANRYADLAKALDDAARATADWHNAEPRIWGRAVRGLWSGFAFRTWPQRLQRWAEQNRHHAEVWLERSIASWRAEGRIDSRQEHALRSALQDEGVAAVVPNFGAHLGISIVLRFPLGSLARAAYTTVSLAVACALLLSRKIDRATWRRQAGIHAPWVIVLALIPGAGTFAYLTSVPVIKQFVLVRLAADAIGEKMPFSAYRKLGLKRIVAPPPHRADSDRPNPAPEQH